MLADSHEGEPVDESDVDGVALGEGENEGVALALEEAEKVGDWASALQQRSEYGDQ
jgi:hypothetical protein